MAPVSGLSNLGRSMLGRHASQSGWWADTTCKELHTKRHLLTRTCKLSFHQHLPASRESKTHLHSHFSSLTLNFWPIIFSFHIIPGNSDWFHHHSVPPEFSSLSFLSQGSRTLVLGQPVVQRWGSSSCCNQPHHRLDAQILLGPSMFKALIQISLKPQAHNSSCHHSHPVAQRETFSGQRELLRYDYCCLWFPSSHSHRLHRKIWYKAFKWLAFASPWE